MARTAQTAWQDTGLSPGHGKSFRVTNASERFEMQWPEKQHE